MALSSAFQFSSVYDCILFVNSRSHVSNRHSFVLNDNAVNLASKMFDPSLFSQSKGLSILFNHFIGMRTTVNLSISYRKNVFL